MSDAVYREAFNMLCGEKLGSGSFRDVFAHKWDPSLVVKVETPDSEDERTFHNVKEWEFWIENQGAPTISKWLAPCVELGRNGLILIQKRVEPLRERELPEKLPGFLTDLKMDHFGYIGKQVVCCDYAYMVTNISTRMRYVKWERN